MTTIATDGRTMAADRACNGNGYLHGEVCKLRRAKDGSIIGLTGTPYAFDAFAEWFDSDRSEPFDGKDDELDILVLCPDGRVLAFNHTGRCYEAGTPACAGSGSQFAYGAMDAGADPRRAVEIATIRDHGSGCGVDVMARPDKDGER